MSGPAGKGQYKHGCTVGGQELSEHEWHQMPLSTREQLTLSTLFSRPDLRKKLRRISSPESSACILGAFTCKNGCNLPFVTGHRLQVRGQPLHSSQSSDEGEVSVWHCARAHILTHTHSAVHWTNLHCLRFSPQPRFLLNNIDFHMPRLHWPALGRLWHRHCRDG